MSTIVFEHVSVTDLPSAWRRRLGKFPHSRVTVRIEAEPTNDQPTSSSDAGDPLFGMWQDRADGASVEDEMNRLRESRFDSRGFRRDS